MKLSFTVDLEDEGSEGISVAVYGDEPESLLFARSGIEDVAKAMDYLKSNLEGWVEDVISDDNYR